MKKILIIGSNGLLGQKISGLFLLSKYYQTLNASIEDKSYINNAEYIQLDITKREDVLKVVDSFEPDVIINTAAITNVDYCETNREVAWRVNVKGVENLVYAARLSGSKIIHFSTDYVFDGKKGPYSEDDTPNPISYYGRTKLASENVLKTSGIQFTIIRTMILFGIAKNVKENFALWVYKNLSVSKPINVVTDQFGNPTLVDDLALAVLRIVEYDKNGLYHIAGKDILSRYEFAIAIADKFKLDKKLIKPIKTNILNQPAPRPLKSGLITLKAEVELGVKMSDLKQSLKIFERQLIVNKQEEELKTKNI